MYKEPIFLTPVFKERIWGGRKLKEEFDYDIPNDNTGEAWVVAALSNGSNKVENESLTGQTLLDLWNDHGELFNKDAHSTDEYPLLVKVLDANDDLSVQVHPDDAYARKVEDVPYGKTECWYVLEAEPGAEIVLGHHAQTKDELDAMIDQEKWDELLRRQKVSPGDFYYVPSGTIHAIGKGIMILEIQQSSDVTYRVYDYDRTDQEGNKRELHLERAKDVTTVPDDLARTTKEDREIAEETNLTIERLTEAEYFSVYHWSLDGEARRELTEDFLQVSVIEGEAAIRINEKSFQVQKGQHFIIPHGVETYELSGRAEFVVSHV
ncbi:mannose-6-phosphate isomerase, class I [Virgibacillus sp. MSJ-26]|uniref:mannose-6-phosphate isomerase, class I n=1 Tax=Virgibacillus sp. MSJ-26 TaxID=2841522 RepID=UPI001C11FA15|nr:mannose-6-phosphate isomerase, class I [Virgibacillus sp. MSJ-26]MBU5468329.1 mannose-6-phosphate isomerase, class I [Virgibacillus sp. MSJ-26]